MVVGVALILAVVAGLQAAKDLRDCTLIGSGPSNVSVRLESAGGTIIEFCVDDQCEGGNPVGVSADAGAHSFRASVVAPDGTPVEHSGEVRTTEVWPNGEGCGSRRAYATVLIKGDGTVTTLNPWPVMSGNEAEQSS